MQLRRYKLTYTITATANGADTMSFQRPGRIRGINVNVLADSVTDNGVMRVQLSKSAVSDFGSTGGAISQSLAECHFQSNFVTSGLSQPNFNFTVPCDDRVQVGESVYINAVVSGTVSCTVQFTIIMEES